MMCQINPMSEIRAIAETCRRKCLSSNARLLWRVLFDCANDRQEWNAAANAYDWPEDFFPITNAELSTNSALEKRAFLEARNVLREIGAIEFIPGENNHRPARYKLCYLTAGRGKSVPAHDTVKAPVRKPVRKPVQAPDREPVRESVPQPVQEPVAAPRYQDKDTDTEKNEIKIMNTRDDDDEEKDTTTYTRTRATGGETGDPVIDREERSEEIRKGFRRAFRRTPYPGELEQLVKESWDMGFKPIMVSKALEVASLYEPGSPANYVLQMLKDWAFNEVWLPHHVDDYQLESRPGALGPNGDELRSEAKKRRRMERVLDGLDGLPY